MKGNKLSSIEEFFYSELIKTKILYSKDFICIENINLAYQKAMQIDDVTNLRNQRFKIEEIKDIITINPNYDMFLLHDKGSTEMISDILDFIFIEAYKRLNIEIPQNILNIKEHIEDMVQYHKI